MFSTGDVSALSEVCALLAGDGLPTDDVAQHIESFILARSEGRLVGVVGVQVLGPCGLLRSLCVARDQRGQGLGASLLDRMCALARSRGVADLYLLTTTARTFFERKGFRSVPRDAVAEPVRLTEEFRSLCPATAVCMQRSLADDPREPAPRS